MATPRLGLVVEDKPTELSCTFGYQQDNEAKDHFHVHLSDTTPCLSCSSENGLRYQLICLEESFSLLTLLHKKNVTTKANPSIVQAKLLNL